MPEEKKDSFTFSDKIKSSKPAGNKSFAKSSAKIGRNGKPKATLFERTRRDAPFFIAALVALLLLPFLYKYSGQASEDQFLTPSSESSNFDPERYGFDTAMIEDPDGQIAQLAGRDSLSLIKGWGNNQEEDYARDDMDLDASASYEGDSDASYAAQRHSSSEMDVEDNTTNIYKRRARAGTRAAFRRTKIGTLNGAVLRRPGGSRLGINHWGGGLKNAAKKVGSNPTGAPKPVSLQPLRAAGPARSSFGQGAAQAARKGLDNMGKANAVEALRDSYVKPVDPTRTAGVNLFSDGRSGGSGKLNHNINIGKGQTPWWWDMMKTRMQKEWEARFKRKWDWINWMDKLAQNILGQVANCLITGHSGGDVDHMLGDYGVNSSVEATCCGQKKDRWAGYTGNPDLPFDKNTCKGWQKSHKDSCPDGWKAATGGNNLNFFQQRLCCFGICNSGAYASGNLGLSSAGGMECANMPDYNVVPSGQARKWNVYTYVVARNYFPENLKAKFPGLPNGQNLLCASTDRKNGGSSLVHEKITSGVGHVEPKNAANQQILDQIKASKHVSSEQQEIRERIFTVDQESLKDACVVVVSQGNYLTYNAVRNAIIDRFKDLGKKSGKSITDEEAVQAFNHLDLFFVSSFAAKDKLAYAKWFESGHNLKNLLPMPYWEFENAYIQHKKVTHKKDGSKDNVYKAKWRVEDQDMVRGEICFYDNTLSVSCQDDQEKPQATVTFKGGYKGTDGKSTDLKTEAENLRITAQFTPLNGAAGAELNMHDGVELESVDGKTLTYTLKTEKIKDAAGKTMAPNGEDLVGNVTWKVYRNARTQSQAHAAENANKIAVFTATCTLNLSGDGYTRPVPPKECQNKDESAACCAKLHPAQWGDNYEYKDGKCQQKTVPPPTPGQPDLVYLAPIISWVPGDKTCRQPKKTAGQALTEKDNFNCSSKYVEPAQSKNDQHCGSQTQVVMDSQLAKDFVAQVVKKYNDQEAVKQKKLAPLSEELANKYPTDGEFVDALHIAKELGINQVPSAAVCELARDFVRVSKDQHAGNMPVAGSGEDFKNLKRYYRNELGAFLAYVHPTSILYPARYYGKEMVVCDWRFLPEGSQCGGRKSTMKMGKAYYFNYYNDSANKASLAAYLASFDDVKIPKTYPLAELVKGHSDLPHNCPTDNCASSREKYNKDDYFGLMISDRDASDNKGEACVAFAGQATMSVVKALEYVQDVCRVGLDAKPYGNQFSDKLGPKNYVAGQTFTRKGTSGGNDGSTQKQPDNKGRG